MRRETCITVPVEQMGWVADALVRAGVTVLDTGERVTTEEKVGGEAVLAISPLQPALEAQAEAEVSISKGPLSDR